MGVILEYAKGRMEEIRSEVKSFVKNPIDYVLKIQPIRRALLLEYLDNVRPRVGTRWEHRVAGK